MRLASVAVFALALGCNGGSAACDLADEYSGCPECYDGEVTCTFDDVSVTEGSCQECQARGALYRQLCDAGSEASRADLEAAECTLDEDSGG